MFLNFFSGIAGLAVTYGINLNVQQAAVIWNICNAENKMISVERVLQYSKLTSEAPLVIEDSRPSNEWPQNGTISFTNLKVTLFCILKIKTNKDKEKYDFKMHKTELTQYF